MDEGKSPVKWLFVAGIFLLNLFLWLMPSDVAYLVAQQRDVLLGRYSLERFVSLIVLLPVSLGIIKLLLSRRKPSRKDWYKTVALTISIGLSVILMDAAARMALSKNYEGERSIYHRIPNTRFTGTTRDLPETAYSYPQTPQGYPTFDYTLTVDKRGFRNQQDLDRCDILALGDSFTEGSQVSDEHVWPVLLAQKSGQVVYDMGMSGGHPGTYIETLKRFGLELQPHTVICMLYEGNDFKNSNYNEPEEGFFVSLNRYKKTSPIRRMLENLLLRSFGPIGSPPNGPIGPDDPLYPVAWLPIWIPAGENGRPYTMTVKSILEHYLPRDAFEKSPGCRQSLLALGQLQALCREKQIRLIVVFAPDRPHTLLPLVRDELDPRQIHAFLSTKAKNLPGPEALFTTLFERLEICEAVVRDFCREESIEFVSLTAALRDQTERGKQTYLAYNIHWSPAGHVVAADVLWRYLQETAEPSSPSPKIEPVKSP